MLNPACECHKLLLQCFGICSALKCINLLLQLDFLIVFHCLTTTLNYMPPAEPPAQVLMQRCFQSGRRFPVILFRWHNLNSTDTFNILYPKTTKGEIIPILSLFYHPKYPLFSFLNISQLCHCLPNIVRPVCVAILFVCILVVSREQPSTWYCLDLTKAGIMEKYHTIASVS